MWSLGITIYTGIYARIGTGPLAAVSIASTIEGVAIVPFIALANAAAIMLGNRIGAGKFADAMDYAGRFIFLSVSGGAVMGLVILVARGALMSLYRISPEARIEALGVLGAMAITLWLKAGNLAMIVGVMRSGGDTRFAFLADIGPMWLLGIPIALFSAFILALPV
jgi:Na+-driven multidrug efflux pump